MSPAAESAEVAELDDALLALIARGESADRDSAQFEALARRVFAHQYELNAPYRRLCDADGVTPANLPSLEHIPACPTEAFKEFALTTFPPAEAMAEYHSSGTTAERASLRRTRSTVPPIAAGSERRPTLRWPECGCCEASARW